MSRRLIRRLQLAKNRVASPRHAFTAVVERCAKTGLCVGHVPGFAGAHSQGATLEELRCNLGEVVTMLMEDGEPRFESEFVGTLDLVID